MGNTKLEWSDKFSTDIVSIDRQHQELIYLSQNLLDVLSSGDASVGEVQSCFEDLVAHALAHFEYEERIMRNIGYPGLKGHMAEHNDLRTEIGQIADEMSKGQSVDGLKGLISLVQVWVLRHIVSSDSKIRDFMRREDDEDDES